MRSAAGAPTKPQKNGSGYRRVAREIQAELTYHQTWMDLESSDVAAAYLALITELRRVAGGHVREAWIRARDQR